MIRCADTLSACFDLCSHSPQMAKAGFIFTPTAEAPDLATCLYCELGLDGWEAPDDP
jgi:hypothetical protein